MANKADSTLIRTINDRLVYDLFVGGKLLSKPDVGKKTGLSKPAVLDVLGRLLAAGLIENAGVSAASRPGPSAELFRLVPTLGNVAAVALTPESVRVEIYTITGKKLGSTEAAIQAEPTVQDVAGVVGDACAAAKVKLDSIGSTVMGVPGAVNPKTMEVSSWDLPSWTLNVEEEWTRYVPGAFACINEVDLRAVAEHDANPHLHHFVLIALGQGIGASIMIGGELYRGAHGAAGELGYMPRTPSDLAPIAGHGEYSTGLQAFLGGNALVQLAREHGLAGETVQDCLAEAMAGTATGYVEAVSERIAMLLSIVGLVVDPEYLILAGPVGIVGGQALVDKVQQRIQSSSIPSPVSVRSTMVRDNAICAGAMALALETQRERAFTQCYA
ncbi:ROK family protein [Specibacter sp. NPDC057265]|uniref:ROK family protein n=1 Tax=Specibacter sp. NPDC057265 TaxID=3346075 RepID=UPI003643B13C